MSQIIRLHSNRPLITFVMSTQFFRTGIRIRSLTNPHDDLPADMQLFAQLIIDGNIFLQTVPVDSEASESSWKLDFGCNIPTYTPVFVVAILRHSQTVCTRLLGSVEIGRGEVLGLVEANRPFKIMLNKVNLDGPLLEVSAGFSFSEGSATPLYGFDVNEIGGNRITSVRKHGIPDDLRSMKNQGPMDPLELWVMHERLLLVAQSNETRARCLNILGDICLKYYTTVGSVEGLLQAVGAYSDAVRDDPTTAMYLSDLGNALRQRFEQLGNVVDINQGRDLCEAAVRMVPDDHPDKPSWLNNLGNCLLNRFDQLGDLTDLNELVSTFKAAVRLTPEGHAGMPSWLNNLGNSLLSRFKRFGNLTDLNESVDTFKAAVSLTPEGHPDKPLWLNDLGNSLHSRFKRLGDLTDLNESVSTFKAAVSLTPEGHPAKPLWLNNLGNSLLSRFERLGNLTDLNESVSTFKAGMGLIPEGHPHKPSQLTNLGNSLLSRFKRFGNLTDLNESVSTFKAAVRLTPEGHPDRPLQLNNLGNSLSSRFGRLGDLTDLNESVSTRKDALNNLGNSLRSRFERLGDLTDLNESVSTFKAAVSLTPEGHPAMPSQLNNLGNSLLRRFERLGDLTDLNESVSAFEAVISLTPEDHAAKPSWLSNLGNALRSRFERLGDLTDLNDSREAAIRLTPDGHPDKPAWLNNLGNSLRSRFERLGDLTDLNESVSTFKAAVSLTPEGHPAKPLWLNNLGNSLLSRFERLQDPHDLEDMLLQYSCAASSPTGAADVRFQACAMWTQYAHIFQHPSLLHAYTTAVDLIPKVAWLGLSISDRHHQLLNAGEIVRNAASAAIDSQEYSQAVEWLEQGRSVIWGQVLNLRSPVDDLQMLHPKLAAELISISNLLETSGTQSGTAGFEPSQSLEITPQQYHDHAARRNELLHQIRGLAGFERFLLPKPISELSQAAKMGPVVLLNTSIFRCDALILMPGLGDKFSRILSVLWMKVVKPVLNGLAFTVSHVDLDLGRIWWCPTGAFAFLPIHAAGLYGQEAAFGSKLSDFFISSYTPSLSALIESLRAKQDSQDGLQLLAVAQPSAVGQNQIPGTIKEIASIQQLAQKIIPVLRLEQDTASVESVQKGMRESRWAHFACHGIQDIFTPTNSALLLAGSSKLTLSNIIQLQLPHADLAFLSACQTATGSKHLVDEAVHLTAGMLLAGYRGVIGTMWSILDNDGPQVANSTRAAEALHLAVKKLRDSDCAGGTKSFSCWVPFIHVGV
ncbi:TPR-like protein [Mycena latifolia]|nr:TPR-like protein [Mycena latifolia]